MSDVGAEAFLSAARSKQIVTYLDVVAAAVLAYDYALNLGDEAKYIWFSPLSLGKALYFLTRYPVIVDTSLVLYHQFAIMSPGQCQAIYKTIGFLLGIGTFIAEGILVMRTWVIWNRGKTMGIALVLGLVLCWVPVFFFLAQSLNSLVFANPPAPQIAGCFLHSQKNILFVVFLIITVFESFILGFTLIRFAPNWRRKKTALIRTIYRDGIFNYAYLCILSICNVVVLLTAPRGYTTLLSALQRVMHSILSSRVLLNLRQAADAPAIVDTLATQTHHYGAHTNSQVLFQPWVTMFVPPAEDTSGVVLRNIGPTHTGSSDYDYDEFEQDIGPSRHPYAKRSSRFAVP